MTAVPGDGHVVTVICDACGTVEEATDVLHDEEMVWPSITQLGWTGSPFATGTHRCPRCETSVRAECAPAPTEATTADGLIDVQDAADTLTRIITLHADLEHRIVDQLRPALDVAVRSGRNVILDLADAGTVDSAGLGLLVRAHRAVKPRGAVLCLVAPSRFVITVLHTMHLDDVFPVYPDTRTALRRLRVPSPRCTGPRAYR
ncbi:STAS domain-containing protein [Actinoplanes sp. NPDC051859]|uniref:STAS domain-containing protein n=1 Tax=Actinoplanes sp. NPDC051859 TaxID=3363909 RepID=UPI0037A825DA